MVMVAREERMLFGRGLGCMPIIVELVEYCFHICLDVAFCNSVTVLVYVDFIDKHRSRR